MSDKYKMAVGILAIAILIVACCALFWVSVK